MYMQGSNVNDVIIQTTIIAVVVAKKALHGQLWHFQCTEFLPAIPRTTQMLRRTVTVLLELYGLEIHTKVSIIEF